MRTIALFVLLLAGCSVAGITAWLAAAPSGYPNWQILAAGAWLVVTALLKRSKNTAANEPLELVANVLVRVPVVGNVVLPWVTPGTVERKAGPPPPSLLLPLLAVLLLPAPALADDPPLPIAEAPVLAPTRGQLVLPAEAAPNPAPIPASDLAGKIGVARNQLELLAVQLGVPVPRTLPPAFWDTTPGKVVSWTLFGVGLAAAGAQTGISIWQQVR